MTRDEIKKILSEEIVSTGEALKMLGCTRQYIYQLVKGNKLEPIRVLDGDKLFLKQDVLDLVKAKAAKRNT